MSDIEPHQPGGGEAMRVAAIAEAYLNRVGVPAAITADNSDDALAAANRLIDAIVTVYTSDVAHPRWCDSPACTVRPGGRGTHRSEAHRVETPTAIISMYVEARPRGGPLLILERRPRPGVDLRPRQGENGAAEPEPFTDVVLPVPAARGMLAALATLVEDLGPVTP